MARKANAKKVTVIETVKKGRKPVPENETRHDKLVRLADARVNKACKYIRLVGNLALYKPDAAEIRNIMEALAESCANVNNRLEGVSQTTVNFSLHKG